MIDYDKALQLREKFGDKASDVVLEVIDALSNYDQQTETYLKEEFGLTYFSAELQGMDGDFRFWHGVFSEIKNIES